MRATALLALCSLVACAGADPVPAMEFASRSAALEGQVDDVAATTATDPATPVDERRLIRTGELSVRVDDFAPLDREIRGWLEAHGGYVSDASSSHAAGQVSWATLHLKVPSDHLDALVGWTEEHAEVTNLAIRSQDVTAQWVDLEARLDNAKRAEERLQAILADDAAALSDVLAVERELTRVRGDIEAGEAQMRALSHQVALASLTLNVQVSAPYAPLVAQTFGQEAAATFEASVDALGATARGLALVGVAVSPWVGTAGVFGFGLFGAVRTLWRRRR